MRARGSKDRTFCTAETRGRSSLPPASSAPDLGQLRRPEGGRALGRTAKVVVALAGIRLGLALAGLEAAIAAGVTRRAGGLGWLLGAFAGAVFVLTDARGRLLQPRRVTPRQEAWWKAALRGTYPSTIGLAVLAAISLAFSPVLAAVLAGVIGGLGIAGILAALALRA